VGGGTVLRLVEPPRKGKPHGEVKPEALTERELSTGKSFPGNVKKKVVWGGGSSGKKVVKSLRTVSGRLGLGDERGEGRWMKKKTEGEETYAGRIFSHAKTVLGEMRGGETIIESGSRRSEQRLSNDNTGKGGCCVNMVVRGGGQRQLVGGRVGKGGLSREKPK